MIQPFRKKEIPEISDETYEFGIKPLVTKTRLAGTFDIVGFDTETLPFAYHGIPVKGKDYTDIYSIQVSSDNKNDFHYADFKAGIEWLYWIFPKRAFVFAHNLPFDLSALLGKDYEDFLKKAEIGTILKMPDGTRRPVTFRGMISEGAVMSFAYFTVIDDESGKAIKRLRFVDTMNFYGRRSLAAVAREQFPNDPALWKREKPEYLGARMPTDDEIPAFIDYAVQDAAICRLLGKKIIANQESYEIRPRMTPASFSVDVFRKLFLKKPIPMMDPENMAFAWACYSGGRFEAFGRGTFKGKIRILDYNSLYPYSATFPLPLDHNTLTDFSLEDFERDKDKIIGFFHAKFRFPDGTPYPNLPHRTKKLYFPLRGETYATSYELIHALEMGAELSDVRIKGFYPTPSEIDNPIRKFVLHFYEKKSEYDEIKKRRDLTEKEKDERTLLKLILNSFYGKFAERNKEWKGKITRAGRIFHPAYAALITGKAREMLSRAVVKYESLYSDTDSIATLKRPDRRDMGEGLGKLKTEITADSMTIIKPKLYYAYNKKDEKIAYHSFRKAETLKQFLLHPGSQFENSYSITRFLKVKEALARGLIPRSTLIQTYKFHIDPDDKRRYREKLTTIEDLVSRRIISDPIREAPPFK